MDIEISFINMLSDTQKEQVWDLLCECDREFIPPLSARNSSYQGVLSGTTATDELPTAYYKEMLGQLFLVAEYQENIIGFMTFKHNYECEELKKVLPNNYITTICVNKDIRNKGITKKFYHFMENKLPEEYRLPYITTRTWNANVAHIRVLEKLGFKVEETLLNHRGEGIDTIYFSKLQS
ncbi:hypothetical protein BTR23_02355 [Alkalihalophilus pseudofirmus]|uniref:GNAT family N-acetyltransferase n=1 Tax=Alkalihalobacterium alkalinitrilicum TaxID=427920 RepID=UPI00094CBE2B|nr:GNAT family N-acetyltransferase [Alkalihalobacterium alkalinitrilicum]OLO42862.1 hypothetical protein BTR23_02355 [Alkalihalophilus pseudofirmus]